MTYHDLPSPEAPAATVDHRARWRLRWVALAAWTCLPVMSGGCPHPPAPVAPTKAECAKTNFKKAEIHFNLGEFTRALGLYKNAYRCIKYAGKGKSHKLGPGGDAESCLTADVKNRVAWREERLLRKEARKCLAEPEQLPDYAYMGSETVMLGADEETWGMLGDVFGNPDHLNDVVVSRKVDKDAAKCQYKTYRKVSKLYYAKMKTFVRCKKYALKGKYRFTDPHAFGNTDERGRVESLPELQAEILACVAADPKGKIARAKRRLERKVLDKCELEDMSTPLADVFPGKCAKAAGLFDQDPRPFMDCLDEVTENRLHTSMNAFDGFTCP